MPLTYQQRLMAIPAWIRVPLALVFVLPGVALGIYWWNSYTGVYQWLIEGQDGLFGGHLPVYTGIFTVCIGAVMGGVPVFLISFVLVKLNVFPADAATAVDMEARTARFQQWERDHRGRLIGLMIGVITTIGGLILILIAAFSGSLQTLKIADLEAGKAPPSNYVQARGRLLTERMVTQSEGGFQKLFVPLVSDQWKEGSPITLYVHIPDLRKDEALKGPIEGTLEENGLPGPIRTSFERSTNARPASKHYYLQMGHKPETKMEFGLFLLGVGAVVLLATAAVWVVKGIRERNTRL